MIPADGIDNDCDDRVDEEVRDFKDNDGDGLIDEDLLVEPMVVVYPPDRNVTSCSVSIEVAQSGTVEVRKVASKCQPATVSHTDMIATNTRCRRETVRQWLVVDSCGNVERGTQMITVEDVTPPAVTAPLDVRVSCGHLHDTSTTGMPQVSDDCQASNASVWFEDSVSGCSFERRWSAEDGCGGRSTAVQRIIPVLEAGHVQLPENKLLSCGESSDPLVTGSPMAEGRQLCSNKHAFPVTLSYTDSKRIVDSCRTVITRNWLLSDRCGNFSNFQQEIIIKTQFVSPVIFPSDISVNCQHVQDLTRTGRPSMAQSCLEVDVSLTDSVANCHLSRKWVVRDECGRLINNKTQTIQLKRNNRIVVSPTITARCQDTVEHPVVNHGGEQKICGGILVPRQSVSVSDETVSGDQCRRQVTRRITIAGNCAADAYQEQTIVYEDREPPTLDIPADTEASCELASNLTFVGLAVAKDSCSKLMVNHSDSLIGTTLLRAWSAADACGNRATTKVQRISLIELEPRVMKPIDQVQECGLPITPNITGWPEIERDISLMCFDLGGSLTTISYEDYVTGSECEQTVKRTWRIETFLGHLLRLNQTIKISKHSVENVEVTVVTSVLFPSSTALCEDVGSTSGWCRQ